MDSDRRRRVAIACQGGGSHTAFTAGALTELLGATELEDYDIVAISGTSGGAICALLAWTALLEQEPEQAGPLLEGFWADNAASTPMELLVNPAVLWVTTLQNLGLLPFVSPYDIPVDGLGQFRKLLDRWVDFDRLDAARPGVAPLLLIGAVDVLSGHFRAFNSWREPITADAVLASAAIPTLFPAVRIDDGAYWDGLFSQNPPVRDLLEAEPDELWVIQINPTETDQIPRSVLDIANRRNELAGNLSLYQELHVIEKIDQLLAEGLLASSGRYRQVVVRVLEFARSGNTRLWGPVSKINRDPRFLQELIGQGRRQAAEFLTALSFEECWRSHDADALLRFLHEDCELTSGPPFAAHHGLQGDALREFVRGLLEKQVDLDLTRKQLVREQVRWTIRTGMNADGRAQVVAEFRDAKVHRLLLGVTQPAS
jgi:NTE family protein